MEKPGLESKDSDSYLCDTAIDTISKSYTENTNSTKFKRQT
jgi:hypothetical protein